MNSWTSAWQRFLAEMKRRRVFRAMAFYGTGVFALLQLADLVSPTFGLPPFLLKVLMLTCLAGFPVAVFAAWTFDLTAYGLQRTQVAASGEIEAILALPVSQRWPAGLLGLLGILLLALGSWWVVAQERPVPEVPPVVQPLLSVAVLPLHNLGVASDEPFSDGLTEELGLALSRIEGVRVVAHTSVYAYKGRSIDARTIGRELNVGTIVEGSVQRSGGRVRISVVLSRTADGFRVWTETWDRELTAANVFAIQDAIAAEAAKALATGAGPLTSPGRIPTLDLKAYDLYLLGQQRWADRNADALHAAILNYGDAIVRDPAFVSAWVGLARAWRVLPFYDPGVSGSEAYGEAVRAADRALALAPDLAEANAVRGIIAAEYDADFVTADRLLTRAIELRPDYAEAHGWMCATLALSGRDAEALPACRQAVALDPLGSIPNLLLSWPLAGTGHPSEALAQVERALSLEPDVIYALFRKAELLLRAGRRADAADALEQLGRQEGASDPGSLRAVAAAYPGVAADARAIAAVRALERETAPGLYYLAALYDWAGSRKDALRTVESAAAARNPWLAFAAVTSAYDGLRTEPRFRAILQRMGLPNGNTAYRSATR